MSQKKFAELITLQDWFLGLANTLQAGLKKGFVHSFQEPRLDLLKHYNVTKDEALTMHKKIEQMSKAVEKDSKNIYQFTGYVEKKRGVSRADSESSESSADQNDDGP